MLQHQKKRASWVFLSTSPEFLPNSLKFMISQMYDTVHDSPYHPCPFEWLSVASQIDRRVRIHPRPTKRTSWRTRWEISRWRCWWWRFGKRGKWQCPVNDAICVIVRRCSKLLVVFNEVEYIYIYNIILYIYIYLMSWFNHDSKVVSVFNVPYL